MSRSLSDADLDRIAADLTAGFECPACGCHDDDVAALIAEARNHRGWRSSDTPAQGPREVLFRSGPLDGQRITTTNRIVEVLGGSYVDTGDGAYDWKPTETTDPAPLDTGRWERVQGMPDDYWEIAEQPPEWDDSARGKSCLLYRSRREGGFVIQSDQQLVLTAEDLEAAARIIRAHKASA